MRTNALILFSLCLALISAGCGKSNSGGDTEPTEQELALAALQGTWSLANGGTIARDGNDVSANYSGFTVRLSEGTYQTTNAGDLFSASGTWTWLGQSTTQFNLDDGKTISIEQVETDRWVFSFTQSNGGTIEGVEGLYRITLTK